MSKGRVGTRAGEIIWLGKSDWVWTTLADLVGEWWPNPTLLVMSMPEFVLVMGPRWIQLGLAQL